MISRQEFRPALASLLAISLACSPVRALVVLNDGRDRIFVTGSFSVSEDSNVFANSDNKSDVVFGSGLTAEYTRRAGWIGVNGSVAINGSNFDKNKAQDFKNPSYRLEFTKQSGRTTGSLSFNGARESRADAAVNMRSTSWNYGANLNSKYPAGLNTFTGQFGYSNRKYVESTIFADLATYTSAIDVIHILPAERELVAGYRLRFSETSRNTSTSDHSVTVGLSGRLLRGLSGSIRGGWQARVPHGATIGNGVFSSWTLSGSTSYAFSRKLNVALQLSKDFSTTATDASVDVTSASLSAGYAFTPKTALSFSAGWGNTRFLGDTGRVVVALGPPVILGSNREDSYGNWTAGLSYGLNEHLTAALNYSWFQNWSTSSFADFIRNSWGVTLSSRW
jgi:hypothetical protein